ncbi:MAG: DUF4351 domain-containing protein [Gammaproteobacteria bacterium]|jgi:hypothetical protein|nr:DUF4351 domain-containing protein [Gammaproteobacteria bacterium]
MSHDQNFKNLIVDYPRESIAFFAAVESGSVDRGARILPIREEQLKERLGERFRELDVPLLVEWPDGRRAALLFVFEEETEPKRFSIHRLAHYCLDLADLCGTDRVVPVVIFLHPGRYATRLRLGSENTAYLDFHCLDCALFALRAREHLDSRNLVARLNLPNMAYAPEDKLEVYASAVRGLRELESDPERRLKYLDFIDIYAALDENERILYTQRYPQEAADMSGFAQRFIEQGIEQGIEKGIEQGVQRGEARMLLSLLRLRFGELPDAMQQRIESADADTLLRWSERVLTARTLAEILDDTC